MSKPAPVHSSARAIAACTLTSRITGLVRDMLLVHTFTLSGTLDAFNYGFLIPNLFRRLFGEGTLAAVFVPTFTRTLEHDGPPAAWKLLARTLALLTVSIVAVMLLIEALIVVIWLLAPDGPQRSLTLSLTALMLPFMLAICVVALFSSILNCVGSFVPAALTPVVLNLVMIAGIVYLAPALGSQPEQQIFGVALAVLVAGGLQVAVLLPVLRRHGVTLGWSWRPRDPHVAGMLGMMPPVLAGQGVLLVSTFIDATVCKLLTADGTAGTTLPGWHFDYPLQAGALSAVTVAQRLYQFPLGVLGISLAVAALPTLSRLAARGQMENWSHQATAALRLALFVGLGAGALMLVLAEPIVRLLFEYRRFTPADTARAAHVLVFYGLGLWAFCANHIVLRGFYSLGDVRTPVKISLALMPINVGLSLALVWNPAIREAAFAIASAATSSLAVVIGLVLLRRHAGARLGDWQAAGAVARMLAAAAAAALAAVAVRHWWSAALAQAGWPVVLARAADTLGALLLGTAVFVLVCTLLRLPEPALLLKLSRNRRPRGEE